MSIHAGTGIQAATNIKLARAYSTAMGEFGVQLFKNLR